MSTVTSADGTVIARDRTGTGELLVLESAPFVHHAAVAVVGAVPDGHLVVRRGLGHSKKLDAKAIVATLTEFLTAPATAAA